MELNLLGTATTDHPDSLIGLRTDLEPVVVLALKTIRDELNNLNLIINQNWFGFKDQMKIAKSFIDQILIDTDWKFSDYAVKTIKFECVVAFDDILKRIYRDKLQENKLVYNGIEILYNAIRILEYQLYNRK